MAAPRNPFGGVLGGRLPLLEGGLSGRGGARPSLPKRGPGFSRQRQLDLERAVRQAEQNLVNARAQEAQRKLTDRAVSVDPNKAQKRTQRVLGPPKFSNRLLRERAEPLEAQRRAEAIEKAAPTLRKGGETLAKTFAPLRMDADQVEGTVAKFARPVTARDVRRGGFQAVTQESAPAQELEARLAQVGTRESTADFKVGEPIGFDRTVFSFTNPPERGGSLVITVTEIPANNPARKMIFVSSQRPGGQPNVFLVDSRLSALRIVDQVRETASKVPLLRLRVPGKTQITPRQVFPRPPIPFDRLERGVILDLNVAGFAMRGGGLAPFVKNPSLRTAQELAGPLSELDSPAEMSGGVRGIIRENGDVILFPIDVFHDTAMQSLGLDTFFLEPDGEANPERFILEATRRRGFSVFFDNPVEGRRLLRTNKNLRRLFRQDQLPKMIGVVFDPPRGPSKPLSPATTPREPIL